MTRQAQSAPQDRLDDLDEFCMATAVAVRLAGLSVRQAHQVLKLAGVLINQASGVSAEQLGALTEPQIAAEQARRAADARFHEPHQR